MGQRLIKQPNGLYGYFSEVVDSYTFFNMTAEQALELVTDIGGSDLAERKLKAADAHLHRFEESLDIIERVHGQKELVEILGGFESDVVEQCDD